jgi:hypothetical protein
LPPCAQKKAQQLADQLHPGQATPAAGLFKEARDTIAGCRDRAAKDRLQAASSGTENGRLMYERSAASWEARAHEIEEGGNASVDQRQADRDLWASEEE